MKDFDSKVETYAESCGIAPFDPETEQYGAGVNPSSGASGAASEHGCLLLQSGGWRHLDKQAVLQERADRQTKHHGLPISVDVAPMSVAPELETLQTAFNGSIAVAGCLTGGELTPIADGTRLQTFSDLLLVFRSVSGSGFS